MTPQEFGATVRALRQATHLSAERLAAKAGLTVGTVSLIERGGTKDPGLRVVARLACALGEFGAALLAQLYDREDLHETYAEELERYPARREAVRQPSGALSPEAARLADQAQADTEAEERRASREAESPTHGDGPAAAPPRRPRS